MTEHLTGPRTSDRAGAGPVRAATAFLLDVDDTLIDTRAAMRAAGAASARAAWGDLGEAVAADFGVRYHGDPGGFFGGYTRGELTFQEMRQKRLREAADHFGLAWATQSFDGFEAAWPESFRAAVALFDDVLPFLDAAHAAGVTVGLLTNSSESFTRLKLDAVGLGERFDVVATTDTLGYGKPDARAFTHACGLMGAEPATTVYVGDDLVVDARAARDAGLAGIWLDRRGEGADDEDVPRIETLADLRPTA